MTGTELMQFVDSSLKSLLSLQGSSGCYRKKCKNENKLTDSYHQSSQYEM
jgi:hypothetical protein